MSHDRWVANSIKPGQSVNFLQAVFFFCCLHKAISPDVLSSKALRFTFYNTVPNVSCSGHSVWLWPPPRWEGWAHARRATISQRVAIAPTTSEATSEATWGPASEDTIQTQWTHPYPSQPTEHPTNISDTLADIRHTYTYINRYMRTTPLFGPASEDTSQT